MPPLRGFVRSLPFLIVTSALACQGDNLIEPSVGALEVTTLSGGVEPDPDGYTVQIDAQSTRVIGATATLQTTGVTAGNHTVQLAGIAVNCTVAGENPRSISITAGETTTIAFEVTCSPTTGRLQVSSSTSGSPPHVDSYTVTVDGAARGTVRTNGELRVYRLALGEHVVGLTSTPGNCTVEGANPRSITVSSETPATVNFMVACPSTPGSVQITTITTGASLDPDGYSVSVYDSTTSAGDIVYHSAGTNAKVSIPLGGPGTRIVRLGRLATNCSIQSENPQFIAATPGQETAVSFAVRCVPSPYKAIDLGSLGGEFSMALGINDAGQVVGEAQLPNYQTNAFLWQAGVMKDLGTLGGGASIAYDVNAQGQVVGYSATGTGWAAFLWNNGVMINLGTMGALHSFATAISAAGKVTGSVNRGNGTEDNRGFLWQNGVMTELGENVWDARDLNDAGQVAGAIGVEASRPELAPEYRAALWQEGVITNLGTLGVDIVGSASSVANGINSAGHVVGSSRTLEGTHHAILWRDGIMIDLGTLGGSYSAAWAINSADQVVGWAATATESMHAFIWKDGVMTDLGTVGGYSSVAYAINNAGQVVGTTEWGISEVSRATLWTRE